MAPAQPRPTSASLPVRFARAARVLTGEDRLAALAAAGLLLSLALPWYQKTYLVTVVHPPQQVSAHLSALAAFTLVEGAVMLIALAVLVLLFLKAERGRLSLPGRDGTVLLVAGGWSLALVLFRIFDQPSADGGATVGIAWGIFVALGAAGALTTAGMRTRSTSAPEAPVVRAGSNRSGRSVARPQGRHPRSIDERPDPEAPTEHLLVGRRTPRPRPGAGGGQGRAVPDDEEGRLQAPPDAAATEPLPPGDRLF